MDHLDDRLLDILAQDARKSISSLAGALNVSRATVSDRMSRLEDCGVIEGYAVRINKKLQKKKVAAHVMISVEPKHSSAVVGQLKKMEHIRSIYAVSGVYDLVVMLWAETTEEIDDTLDAIRETKGVDQTVTSILLSTKMEKQ